MLVSVWRTIKKRNQRKGERDESLFFLFSLLGGRSILFFQSSIWEERFDNETAITDQKFLTLVSPWKKQLESSPFNFILSRQWPL